MLPVCRVCHFSYSGEVQMDDISPLCQNGKNSMLWKCRIIVLKRFFKPFRFMGCFRKCFRKSDSELAMSYFNQFSSVVFFSPALGWSGSGFEYRVNILKLNLFFSHTVFVLIFMWAKTKDKTAHSVYSTIFQCLFWFWIVSKSLSFWLYLWAEDCSLDVT